MGFVRSVLGDIAPEELGICDCHDHLLRTSGPELNLNSWYCMDRVSAAKKEFEYYLEAGGKSMICMDPLGAGRGVPKMLELAEHFRGRGHIVMATGFLKGSLYDHRGHWSVICPREKVVETLVKEVTEGMDRYSYQGPIVERCHAKAGVIKAGTGMQQITPFEQNALIVAARAQAECGAPVSVHTEKGTMGLEAVQILKENGADLEHCVLCHTNKMNDCHYLRRLLDTGINLCFDGPDRPEWLPDSVLAGNIKTLIDWGYEEQLVMAMDAGRNVWQKAYMEEEGKIAKGIAYLLTDFRPLLREMGVKEAVLDKIFSKNPGRIFSIK